MRALIAAAAILSLSNGARADSARRVSVGLFGGYAAEGKTIAIGGASYYRTGVGVRAGVSLPKLYLGIAFTHHLGSHDVAESRGLSFDARYNSTLVGPEIGYDGRWSTHAWLRPYLGGGVLYEYSRTTLNGAVVDRSHVRGQFTLGFLAAYQLDNLFFGVDARAILSPFGDPTRWTPGVYVTAGFAF